MCCASRWPLALLCACVWAALLSGGARAFHPVPHDFEMNILYLGAEHILGCFPEKPYTHERITQVALRRVLLEFLRDNPNAYSDSDGLDAFADAQLDTVACVEQLLQMHQNQTNVQQQETEVAGAFEAVADANRDVDKADTEEAREYSQDPKYHFDAERFAESNEQIWWGVNESVGKINAGSDVAVGEARRYVGQALHTLQDFYAHSSWAEMQSSDELEIHGTLGVRGAEFQVAPPNVSTCVRVCAGGDGGLCTDYLDQEALNAGYLTSGYFEHSDYGPANRKWFEQSRNVRKPNASVALKCSHGSEIDESRRREPVGGINKDFNAASCGTDFSTGWTSFLPDFLSRKVELSPHYTQHKKAALMAVEESVQLLRRLRDLVNNDTKFGRFLGISSIEPVTSVGLVVDTTGTMAKVLVAMRNITRRIIERFTRRGRTVRFVIVWFRDPDVGQPYITTDPKRAQQFVDQLESFGGGDYREMCYRAINRTLDEMPPRTPIFVFTEDESKEEHLLPEIIRKATDKKTPIYILLVNGDDFKRLLLSNSSQLYRRQRRQAKEQELQARLEGRWNSYKRLAITSGGQLLDSGRLEDEYEVARVSALVDTLLSSSRVSLERRWNVSVRSLRHAPLTIAVDPTCAHLDVLISVVATSTVHVQRTSFSLRPPNGNVLAPNFTSKQMTSFLVAAPAPGDWQLGTTGAGAELPNAHVQIAASCESEFDVEMKLLQLRNDTLFATLEPIEGAPLVNSTLIAILRCPNESVQLTQLQLVNSETDELLQSVRLNETGSSEWRFYARLTIPRTSFVTKAVGTVRTRDGGEFGLWRVGRTTIPMGLEFELAAAASTHTVEAGDSLLLKATITLFGEPRNVNLNVTCDPSAPISSNWSRRHLALAAFRTHVVPILVSAESTLANNSMVWVQVALDDVDSSSRRVQRLYLNTHQKPQPRPSPRWTTKRPEKDKPRGAQLPIVRSPEAAPNPAKPAPNAPAAVPDVHAPVCRVELADFERECADAASCASGEWRAEFRFWDEPRATGRVHGVRLFVKSGAAAARSGHERRNWEQAARNASRTSWHKADARPGDNFTFSAPASCCVHELRLRVSDQNGFAAECNASFVYKQLGYSAPFCSIVSSILLFAICTAICLYFQ